jgi:hypothetical protein
MDKPRRFQKTVVGFLVLFVGLYIYNGFLFFFFSIICTLGISLVVWVPLAFFIGSLVLPFFDSVEEKSPISREQRALRDYISRAKNYGLNSEEIKKALQDKGWSEDEIAAAGNT